MNGRQCTRTLERGRRVDKGYKPVVAGGDGQTGISPVLQGGDTGGPDVQVRVLGYVKRDDEVSGRHPCGVSKADHWESGKVSVQQDLGDTGNKRGPTGAGDEVGGQVHWPPAGNGGAVGVPMPTPVGLFVVKRLQGRWLEAKVIMETAND